MPSPVSNSNHHSDSNYRSLNTSILVRLRGQDQRAWEELVRLYAPLIKYWCGRSGLDSHAAADVLQNTFLSVARQIHRFQPGERSGSFRAWLWTITRNKLRDWHRQRSRNATAAGGSSALQRMEAVAAPEWESDDEPTSDIELSRLMHRAMHQVQSEFARQTWTAFERSVLDGRDTASVAEELGVTPAAVRQSRSRILRRIRQQLGEG